MSLISLYRKARRKIQSQISRMKKRGFDTEQIKLPSIPKRITEGSIRRLEKQYSTPKLYEKATFTRPDTGEVISGKAGKAYIRRQAGKKASETKRAKKAIKPVYEKPSKQPIEPAEIQPEYEADIETLYDSMVQKVENAIDLMATHEIHYFSQACSDIAHRQFQDWLSEHSMREVVDVLSKWDMEELQQEHYDSGDPEYYEEEKPIYKALASIIPSVKENEELKQHLMDSESYNVSEDDEFVEIVDKIPDYWF